MIKIPKNNVFDSWLKNLEKLGPSESSVLVVLYNSSQFRNEEKLDELMVEISGQTVDTLYSNPRFLYTLKQLKIQNDFDLNTTGFFDPEGHSIVLVRNFESNFDKNKANYLFNKCKNSIIIFFQADHLDNFDPDFIEDYCTVVIP
jgi:hypothetical protein